MLASIAITRSRCAQCARRYSISTSGSTSASASASSPSRYADVVSNAELQKAISEYNEKMSSLRKQYAKEAEEQGANGPPKQRAKIVQKQKIAKETKIRKMKNVKSIGEAPLTEVPIRPPRPVIPKERSSTINASSSATAAAASAREERLHHLTNLFHLAGGSHTSDSFSTRLSKIDSLPSSSSQESGRHSKGFITNYADLDDRIAAEFGKDDDNLVLIKPYRDGVNVTTARLSGETSIHLAEKLYGVHPADVADKILGDAKHLAQARLDTAREWLEGSAKGYDARGMPTRAIGVRALLEKEREEATSDKGQG